MVASQVSGPAIECVTLPIVIIGLSGHGGLIRTLRATLLDELSKPYVVTARSKGLTESRLC